MKFRARTNDKRQIEIQWEQVNAYLSKWPPDTVLDVEIVKRQPRKSNPMRKMYFAAILPEFAKYLGYDVDWVLRKSAIEGCYIQVEK